MKNIETHQLNRRVDAVKMVESNPGVVSAISKMVSGIFSPQYDDKGNRKIQSPDYFQMAGIAAEKSRSINDNDNLLKMLPDLELASQILVSSILSPKDMMDVKLNFIPPTGLLTSTASSAIITTIQTHFTQVYNINILLPEILKRMIFTAGCSPIAVIPESSIDHFINKDIIPDLQSYRAATSSLFDDDGLIKNIGILGPSDSNRQRNQKTVGLSLESYLTDNNSYDSGKVTLSFEEYDSSTSVVAYTGTPARKLQKEQVDPFVSFIDNVDALKIPELSDKLAKYESRKRYNLFNGHNVSIESFSKKDRSDLSEQEIYTLISRTPSSRTKQTTNISHPDTLTRRTIGEPLVMELPPESVVPVYVPGQPKKHIGYYLIIDDTGNPLSRTSSMYDNEYLGQQFSAQGTAQHRLIQQAHAAFNGMQCTPATYVDYATRIYGDMIESEMISRLKNGLYKGGAAVARNDEIYRLMLSRTLRAQHTQILFIPSDMLAYFAFEYNPDGTGRSIMDDLKTINSLRAIMTIASVWGSVRNSIGRTVVDIQLEEDDPDPVKSREKAMHAFASSRSSLLPMYLNRPMDIVNTLQQAGVEFNTTGSSKLPDMSVKVNETNSQVQKPDTDLDDNLRRMSFMRFGLSPETVDNGFAGDFATSVIANNILLSRRVKQFQERLSPQITNFVKMIVKSTESLYTEIKETISSNYESVQLNDSEKKLLTIEKDDAGTKKNIVNYVFQKFITEMRCELPSPDTTTIENQYKSFQAWKDLFEEILDAHITPDLFSSELDGETLSNQMDRLKAIVRNYHIRKWCSENGVLNELTSITAKDSDGKPMVNIVGEHQSFVKELSSLFAGIIKSTAGLGKGLDAITEAAKISTDETGGDSSPPSGAEDNATLADGDEFGDIGLDDQPGPGF